jgi:hypothetical protein
VIEAFAWETKPGIALHLVNYTNLNMMRGWLCRLYPTGALRIGLEWPGGERSGEPERSAPDAICR